MPRLSSRASRNASTGPDTRRRFLTRGTAGRRIARKDQKPRSSAAMIDSLAAIFGSGRRVIAPPSIHCRMSRRSVTVNRFFTSVGGISLATIRFHSRLWLALPGLIAAPLSPPLTINRRRRKSKPPSRLPRSPWHWKQCNLRMGRICRSKFAFSAANVSAAGISKTAMNSSGFK